MFYGFLLYLITTVVMVFGYPTPAATPVILPILWNIGALMILIGGYWFFFFIRVDVAKRGIRLFAWCARICSSSACWRASASPSSGKSCRRRAT